MMNINRTMISDHATNQAPPTLCNVVI